MHLSSGCPLLPPPSGERAAPMLREDSRVGPSISNL
jgi:hypothetical protein